MSLIEAIVNKLRPQKIEQNSHAIIEPAEGEEKARLEGQCLEYLQDPKRISNSEFNQFIHNMIRLVGGTEETTKDITISKAPLITDEQNKTKISLTQKFLRLSSFITNINTKIEVLSERQTEKLDISSFSSVRDPIHPFDGSTLIIGLPTTLKLKSYIAGGEEKGEEKIVFRRNLKPEAIKDFAQRLFEVYKSQGQETRPQTPQG